MRKQMKYVVSALAGTLLMAGVAFAATADTPMMSGQGGCYGNGQGRGYGNCYGNEQTLTAEQKTEMQPLWDKMDSQRQQMLETRKEMLQKVVAFGHMTQEQADQITNRMNEHMSRGGNGGCGGGGCGGNGYHGGHHGGHNW